MKLKWRCWPRAISGGPASTPNWTVGIRQAIARFHELSKKFRAYSAASGLNHLHHRVVSGFELRAANVTVRDEDKLRDACCCGAIVTWEGLLMFLRVHAANGETVQAKR